MSIDKAKEQGNRFYTNHGINEQIDEALAALDDKPDELIDEKLKVARLDALEWALALSRSTDGTDIESTLVSEIEFTKNDPLALYRKPESNSTELLFDDTPEDIMAKVEENWKPKIQKPESQRFTTEMYDRFPELKTIETKQDNMATCFMRALKQIDRLEQKLANMRTYSHETVRGLVGHRDATIKQQAERIKALEDVLQKIKNWSEAYPLDIFPKPDLVKAAEVLKNAGMTLDSISADNMRHVLEGVKELIEQALKPNQES